MENWSEEEMDSLMLRMAIEDSSREAAEQVMVTDTLRISREDQASRPREQGTAVLRTVKEAANRERQLKMRLMRGPQSHIDDEEPYPHLELPTPDHIRVLTILPSTVFHDTIICTIEPVPLDISSWYSALSYSWALNDTGDASRKKTIVVDAKTFRITQNLFDFLLRIRDRHRSRRLWVDAICINQTDLVERNSQVARMAQIYQNADKVFVWLGEGSSAWEDHVAYNALKWFSIRAGRIAQNSASGWDDDDGARIAANLGLDRAGSSHQNEWYPILEALNRLWNRRYFTRRWIVQELAYAPSGSLRILWGPHRCSYADFLDGAEQACSIALEMINGTHHSGVQDTITTEELAEETIRLTQKVQSVVHFHDRSSHEQRQDICYALSHCNALRCMDDRDILYALARLDPSFHLDADYMASPELVYTRFARQLLSMSLFDQLLANTAKGGQFSPDLPNLGLPSWVPDLRMDFIDVGLSKSSLTTYVDENNVLECELYCLGTVSDHMETREGIITLLSLESALPQKVKIAPHQRHVCPGDLACCTGWTNQGHVVFLRCVRRHYRIIHVMGQNLFTPIPFNEDPSMVRAVFQIV